MLNLKNILDKIKNNLSEEINTEIICSFNKESSLLENSENVIQSRNESVALGLGKVDSRDQLYWFPEAAITSITNR